MTNPGTINSLHALGVTDVDIDNALNTIEYSDPAATFTNLDRNAYGETGSLYPLKYPNIEQHSAKELYNPSRWDIKKTEALMKTRADIAIIATRNHKLASTVVPTKKALDRVLAPYFSKDNFPEADKEVMDNDRVTRFYLSSTPNAQLPLTSYDPDAWTPKIVKVHGPFYNTGGGDAPKGMVYVIFYEMTPN